MALQAAVPLPASETDNVIIVNALKFCVIGFKAMFSGNLVVLAGVELFIFFSGAMFIALRMTI
ncbi:MAG: hypothetical protein HUJ51_03415 [Eggerthellaceae bacterium]|nr:hypothetical protein [Eggerthellaceae bacterium]